MNSTAPSISSNRPLRLLTFVAVGACAYLFLLIIGNGDDAWKTLKENAREPLKSILATATASVAALLVPAIKKPSTQAPPPPPPQTPITGPTNEPTVPLSVYNGLLEEVDQWRAYGVEIKDYTSQAESLCSLLDTRQAVLRVSAYAILALALFAAAAGFLAPAIATPAGSVLQGSLLMRHFACLAGAFAFGGFIIGIVIFRIRVHTEAWHARRSALVAVLLLNLSAFFVSLPYIFATMWNQPVSVGNIAFSLLVWLALFRLVVSPIICMVCAHFGFWIARWISHPRVAPNNQKLIAAAR